jgi:hypothetical protein
MDKPLTCNSRLLFLSNPLVGEPTWHTFNSTMVKSSEVKFYMDRFVVYKTTTSAPPRPTTMCTPTKNHIPQPTSTSTSPIVSESLSSSASASSSPVNTHNKSFIQSIPSSSPTLTNPSVQPTLTTLSSEAPRSAHIKPTVQPSSRGVPEGAIAGGVLGGIVLVLIAFLIWRQRHKIREISAPRSPNDGESARRSVRRSSCECNSTYHRVCCFSTISCILSVWSFTALSPSASTVADAANFDPTRMVKTGSPFDKAALFEDRNASAAIMLPFHNRESSSDSFIPEAAEKVNYNVKRPFISM